MEQIKLTTYEAQRLTNKGWVLSRLDERLYEGEDKSERLSETKKLKYGIIGKWHHAPAKPSHSLSEGETEGDKNSDGFESGVSAVSPCEETGGR